MRMNLQLNHVVSDIRGMTGMRIPRAILDGARDTAKLAALWDVRFKAPIEVIAAVLCENYRPEHLLTLRQAVELDDVYDEKVATCDIELERTLADLNVASDPPRSRSPSPGIADAQAKSPRSTCNPPWPCRQETCRWPNRHWLAFGLRPARGRRARGPSALCRLAASPGVARWLRALNHWPSTISTARSRRSPP